MYELAVITPCSRPENLPLLHESLRPARRYCRLTWHIVYDAISVPPGPAELEERGIVLMAIRGGEAGKRQINYALPLIPPTSWVWVLDDDNLALEVMFPALEVAIRERPDRRGFVFQQWRAPGRIGACDDIRVHHIDQAQYVLRRDLIGERRYEEAYEADGLFIEALVRERGHEIGRLQEPLAYYNRLKWATEAICPAT